MKNFKTTFAICAFFIGFTIQAQNKTIVNAFTKSYAQQEQSDYDKAIATMKSVYSDKSYEINLRLGWLHYLAGNTAQSVQYYEKAAKIMPAATEPKWSLITVHTKTENWTAIEQLYKDILRLDPKNSSANYNLGLIYYYRKQYPRAKSYFDVALNLKPFGYNNMLMSGWTNYFLGNMNSASVLFHKVLLYSPNDASALEGLSLIK